MRSDICLSTTQNLYLGGVGGGLGGGGMGGSGVVGSHHKNNNDF